MIEQYFEYYHTEEKYQFAIYAYEAKIELKQAFVAYLVNFPQSYLCRELAKKYLKDIKRYERELLETQGKLKDLKAGNPVLKDAENQQENSRTNPEIEKQSKQTSSLIEESDNAEELLHKAKTQLDVILAEIKKLETKTEGLDAECLHFKNELLSQKQKFEEKVEFYTQEFKNKQSVGLNSLADLIDLIQSPPPGGSSSMPGE